MIYCFYERNLPFPFHLCSYSGPLARNIKESFFAYFLMHFHYNHDNKYIYHTLYLQEAFTYIL